jgi:hypothetical protein
MNAMARCGTRTILRRSAPGRLLLRLQNHQRQLCRRSGVLIPLLALLPLLSSCQGPRQSLHVLVVPIARLEWLRDDYRNEQEWEPLRREFRKIHPEVDLQISVGSESNIKENLRLGRSRGLGPDLLLVQAPVAMALLDGALVQPLPEQPEVRRSLALVEPNDLKRVTGPRGVAGLPMFSEITLACFDRRRLPQAPTSLDELLAVATSGKPIGLAVEPTSLWWTAGALGAQGALAPIFTGNPRAVGSSEASDRSALETWLKWLRQTTLQSRVDLASGPQDLTVGLESGRLAWIPCYSLTLRRLERTMGAHLGGSPAPQRPWRVAHPLEHPEDLVIGGGFLAPPTAAGPLLDGTEPQSSGAAATHPGHQDGAAGQSLCAHPSGQFWKAGGNRTGPAPVHPDLQPFGDPVLRRSGEASVAHH